MAKSIVNYALGKLCDAAFKEVVLLCGVDDKVELVKRELNRIKCVLTDADHNCGEDERGKNWVNELRSVSNWIEETIDTFVVEVDILSRKLDHDPRVWNKIKRSIMKKPKKLVAIHKFGKEMNEILARIKEIAESRAKYGIQNLGLGESSRSRVTRRPIHPDLDKTELVGFGADKEKIIRQLLDVTNLRRSVVSIVGTGGLGKTTVAQKAYSSDSVKTQFEVRMWMSISQEFNLVDLLKKMLLNFRSIENEEKELEEEYFTAELKKSLQKKKYLIVIDDVWSTDLWEQIDVALPDTKNGSRILITSRFYNIARAADPRSEPYELPFLNKEESLQLLFKIALPSRDTNKYYPTHLADIAEKLAELCDGLPLALVVLGGLLSIKSPTRNVWEKVLETMVWVVEGKKCMDILSTSYDDMPVSLKSCFMYLACFPEDYEIKSRNLIRLWVAEGFIPEESRKMLEDTAENYLEELAQRYMVIVVQRRFDSSIKSIRVHDLLLDLAVNRAKEANLINVFSKKNDKRNPSTGARRVALQFCDDHNPNERTGRNLRSLHCFCRQVPDISMHKMLRVCNMEGDNNLDGNNTGLESSTQLRLFRVAADLRKEIYLNPTVGQLKYLQTLDLKRAKLGSIPECIWHIKTLRCVLLPDYGISGPPSWAKLENLQTLGPVQDSASWQTQLPHLPNLRYLKLYKPYPSGAIAPLFHTLRNLISLRLFFYKPSDYNQVSLDIADMQPFPFYQHLQKLNLGGVWPNTLALRTVMFPSYLIKLRLGHTRLEKDPMPELEKLGCLRILILEHDAYTGLKMFSSAQGFPCLEQLKISWLHILEQFVIKEGAMPTLKLLQIEHCNEFRSLRMHLTCRIVWKNTACSLDDARGYWNFITTIYSPNNDYVVLFLFIFIVFLCGFWSMYSLIEVLFKLFREH